MRVYVATTADQIKDLIDHGLATFTEYLTPEQFQFDSNVDLEEQEHLISQLAADDSFALNQGKSAYVLAVDLNDDQLDVDLLEIKFSQVAALLHSDNQEDELSWYAPEEIKFQLDSWIA